MQTVPARYRRDPSAKMGYMFGALTPRPLRLIAAEIKADWQPRVGYAAAPYLDAMRDLEKITDSYGADSARSVVMYFLANAQGWRGGVARHIKAELQAMLDCPQPAARVPSLGVARAQRSEATRQNRRDAE